MGQSRVYLNQVPSGTSSPRTTRVRNCRSQQRASCRDWRALSVEVTGSIRLGNRTQLHTLTPYMLPNKMNNVPRLRPQPAFSTETFLARGGITAAHHALLSRCAQERARRSGVGAEKGRRAGADSFMSSVPPGTGHKGEPVRQRRWGPPRGVSAQAAPPPRAAPAVASGKRRQRVNNKRGCQIYSSKPSLSSSPFLSSLECSL